MTKFVHQTKYVVIKTFMFSFRNLIIACSIPVTAVYFNLPLHVSLPVRKFGVKSSSFVPTPIVGGRTIHSNAFFSFRQIWPIDMFIVEKCEWYH